MVTKEPKKSSFEEALIKDSYSNPDLVVMKNSLAIAKFKTLAQIEKNTDVSIYQLKIFYEMIASIRRTDTEFQKFTLSYRQFFDREKMTYGKRHEILKKAIKKLAGFVMEFKNERGNTVICSLLSKAEFTKDSVELLFHTDLAPYLLAIAESNFFKFHIQNIRELKSTNSIKIYILLKSWEGNEGVYYELKRFKQDLELDTKGYDKFYDFERRVLKPAIEEINEKNDIIVSYGVKRLIPNNKKSEVIGLYFNVQKKKDRKPNTLIPTKATKIEQETDTPKEESKKQPAEQQEVTPHFNEIYQLVQNYGISGATILEWIRNYPSEQIYLGINYVLNEVKSGKSTQNIGGYINKMVRTTSLVEQSRAENEKKLRKKSQQDQIKSKEKLEREQEAIKTQFKKEYYKAKNELILDIFKNNETLHTQIMETLRNEFEKDKKEFIIELALSNYKLKPDLVTGSQQEFLYNYNAGGSFAVYVNNFLEKQFNIMFEEFRASFAPKAKALGITDLD